MKIPSASEVTPNERLLAALSHASVILFAWGAFAPVVVWMTQRQKSAFVTFHALQALIYQLLQTLYGIVALFFMMFVMAGVQVGTVALAASNERLLPFGMVLSQMLFMMCMFGAFGLYVVVGIAAAVAALLRRDFHYPLIGGRLKRYLEQEPELSVLEI